LIHYEDVDEEAVAGILVYLQGSLTGDEPPDVRQYAEENPTFPHQSSLDQFFTEAQFESYRALGYHVAQTVFAEAAQEWDRVAELPVRLFARIRRRWFPPPPRANLEFVPAAEQTASIERHRSTAPALQPLSFQLYPEMGGAASAPLLHGVNELLQVLEIAWLRMELDEYHAHPINLGWMNTFRRWTSAEAFQKYWPFLRAEYSQGFVRFCERVLNLAPSRVIPVRLGSSLSDSARTVLEWLDQEFLQEWGQRLGEVPWMTPSDCITALAQRACSFAGKMQLPGATCWLLYLGDVIIPCGLVCAAPWPLDPTGQTLELLVWLRGPYRNLGIARPPLPVVLAVLEGELGLAAPDMPYRLFAFYPSNAARIAERLATSMWMNFFFDAGFRTLPRNDNPAGGRMVSLALDLLG
jgi:hypothetical protein